MKFHVNYAILISMKKKQGLHQRTLTVRLDATLEQRQLFEQVIAIYNKAWGDVVAWCNANTSVNRTRLQKALYRQLRTTYPDIKAYDMGNGTYKVYTGWLIEKCGFKGQLLHGIRVNEKNCLVLINESAASYSDLEAARDEIIGAVRDTFRIQIEQEPLEIPQ